MSYRESNKSTYNLLAPKYNEEWQKFIPIQTEVLAPLEELLREEFEGPLSVLDIGCGVGLNAYILQSHGINVTGIDFAPQMVSHAVKNSPESTFLEGDILDTDIEGSYNATIMISFFHLFPKVDAVKILRKSVSLLVPGGYGLISTLECGSYGEGYEDKNEYGQQIIRYRKHWKRDELVATLHSNGLEVIDIYGEEDHINEKNWVNFLYKKK